MSASLVIGAALLYMAVLFAVAAWGDQQARLGKLPTFSPWVYTLSLAVYCTAWTFYGSVGLAATVGLDFLPIYLGPTLIFLIAPWLIGRMIRVSKDYGITSVPDLIAARYGRSATLAATATLVAVTACVPYIALQLKAVVISVQTLLEPNTWGVDVALVAAIALGLFAILFGTRRVTVSDQRHGIVLAVAFESLIKLFAFLALGLFVTFGLYDGPWALWEAAKAAGTPPLSFAESGAGYANWMLITLLSALAILVLPRQFQVAVVENQDPSHLRTASWLFPLYLLAINVFVLPVALAGRLAGLPNGDTYVLLLPLNADATALTLFVFLGGLSAATAMVIVSSVACGTMIANDIVVPLLLRYGKEKLAEDLSPLLLRIRRLSIVGLLTTAYLFMQNLVFDYGLASIGLVAFSGIVQLAPAVLLGLFWREAQRGGALVGILTGTALWAYCLIVPMIASAGWLDGRLLTAGPFGIEALRPTGLFGLDGLSPVAHALLWSLGANVTCIVLGSLIVQPRAIDRVQAALFLDEDRRDEAPSLVRGDASMGAVRHMLRRFVGAEDERLVVEAASRRLGRPVGDNDDADAEVLRAAERLLGSSIGSASARVVMESVIGRQTLSPVEVMTLLDETSKLVRYSHRLETKSKALEQATAALQEANARLQALDRLKDEFVATVSHELRTPLTSIRAFTEILKDSPDLSLQERQEFLGIVARETARLTRLIDDLLDIAKLEAGELRLELEEQDMRDVVTAAVDASRGLVDAKQLTMNVQLPDKPVPVRVDPDRIHQVILNLVSNAVKFAPAADGRLDLTLAPAERAGSPAWRLSVDDNGPGVPENERDRIFGKFQQATGGDRPPGTGLGLTIARQLVEAFGGALTVDRSPLGGASFRLTLPNYEAVAAAAS